MKWKPTISVCMGKTGRGPHLVQNHQIRLPRIYEKYLFCIREGQAISMRNAKATRRVLASFHEYF